MKTGDNMKEHPSRLELRERIVDTALQSFVTHGIKSITMDDIAAALGISKRTLYEVFADKETLLMECLRRAQDERRNRDSEETIAFFKLGIKQGYFRDDVNFSIVNLLVREQLDLLMNTDLCKEYSFLEVYESIMFTYLRGISTEKGARKLEEFIQEYRQKRQASSE